MMPTRAHLGLPFWIAVAVTPVTMLAVLRWLPGEHDPRYIVLFFPLGLFTMGFFGVSGVCLWAVQYPLYGYVIGRGIEAGIGLKVAILVVLIHVLLMSAVLYVVSYGLA